MRHLVLVVATVAVFLVAQPASAEPSILGPTGLIANPTADITPVDHLWVSLNYFDVNGSAVWNSGVSGSISDNIELGAGAIHPNKGDNGFSFFVKWLFAPEQENIPGGAAGITVADIGNRNSATWYVVGSKFFSFDKSADDNAAVHGGVSYTTGDGDSDFDFFGGADVEVSKNYLAVVEYNSDRSSAFQGFTCGVRHYFSPEWTGQVALIDGHLHLGGCYEF